MRHMDEGRLQAWLDRDRSGLSPEEQADIEAHLDQCDECAARLHELLGLDDTLEDLLEHVPGDAEPVPDFAVVAARAREIAGGEGDPLEGGPGSHDSSRGADESASRPALRRPVTWAWAASVVVALGAGWLWNEMSRTGAASLSIPAAPRADAVAEAAREPTDAAGEPAERMAGAADPDAAVNPADAASGVAVPEAAAPAEEAPGETAAQAPAPTPMADAVPERETARVRVQGSGVLAQLATAPVEEPASGWRTVTPEQAQAATGFEPRLVPGLTLVSLEIPDDPSREGVLRAVQALEDGREIVLVQSWPTTVEGEGGVGQAATGDAPVADRGGTGETAPALNRQAAVPEAREGPVSRTLADGTRIVVLGPLPADSLSALLARIR